nr:MAG TPA: hypothetical protein [Caudoviricetes sp.]
MVKRSRQPHASKNRNTMKQATTRRQHNAGNT